MNKGFINIVILSLIGLGILFSGFAIRDLLIDLNQQDARLRGTYCFPEDGCTGTSTKPIDNTILLGNSDETYNTKVLTAGSNITFIETGTTLTIDAAGGGGSYPFTPSTAWGSLAQSTTSILAFPQMLNASGTIGRLTVGSLTATSSITLVGAATGCATFTTGVLSSTGVACGSGSSGAEPFESNSSWGALAQATTSLLAFPQGLISSTTIGRLTVGTLNATSTATSTFAGGISSTGGGLAFDDHLYCLSNPCRLFGEDGVSAFEVDYLTGTDVIYGTSQLTLTGAASQVVLSGNEIGRWTPTGLGIGTTSPYAALSVVGSTGIVASHITATGTATSTFSSGLSANRLNSTATSTHGGVQTTGGLKIVGLGTGLTISSSGDIGLYTGASCTNQFIRSLNASGAATCATVTSADVDTSIVPSTRALTVAGTANQITSSAGSQDLSSDRTWTLSLANSVTFPNTFTSPTGTSTLFASASSTIGNLIAGTFTATSSITFNGVTGTTWADFCTSITGGAGLCDGNDATGGGGGGGIGWASTTAQNEDIYSVGLGRVGIGTTSPWGKLSITATTSTSFPLFVVSTSTASATSTAFIVDSQGRAGVGTTTPGATFAVNGLAVTGYLRTYNTGATSTIAGGLNITNGGLTIGNNTGLLLSSSGAVTQYGGASCTNQFIRSLDASGAATCATVANTDLANSSITFGNGSLTTGSGSTALGGTGTVNFAYNFNPFIVGSIQSTSTTASTFYGQVGVATTTPWGILSVTGTSTPTLSNRPIFVVGTSTASATTTAFIVGSNGQVGIATSSPAAPYGLSVQGSLYTSGTSTINGLTNLNIKSCNASGGNALIADSSGNIGCNTLTAIPNSSLSNSSISFSSSDSSITVPASVALGASGSFTINLANANTWTGGQTFTNATSTGTFYANRGYFASSTMGNVVIGTLTSTSSVKLASSTGAQLQLTDGGASAIPFNIRNISGSLYFATSTASTFSTSSPAALQINGNPGSSGLFVGTTTNAAATGLAVAGTWYSTGLTTESGAGDVLCIKTNGEIVKDDSPLTACSGASSRTVKHDIQSLDSSESLKRILAMNPVSYVYNREYSADQSTHLGFIVEEIQDIDLTLVDKPTAQENVRGLKYTEFVAPIISAIQEMWRYITNHESRILRLERENEELRSRLEKLENARTVE